LIGNRKVIGMPSYINRTEHNYWYDSQIYSPSWIQESHR
jgi:hypothetical protein